MSPTEDEYVLFDAGVFIGALLTGDSRHAEARPLVEAARRGVVPACTTTGILSEVYAALTWHQAQPPHDPEHASEVVRLLVEPPSKIFILPDNREAALPMLELPARHQLRARRVHDARHAAGAIVAGINSVFTYDAEDWEPFEGEGLSIAGPPTTLARLGRSQAGFSWCADRVVLVQTPSRRPEGLRLLLGAPGRPRHGGGLQTPFRTICTSLGQSGPPRLVNTSCGEKPVGLDAAEARRLLKARDRAGVKIQEAFMVRTHPRWLGARDAVQSGQIGELRAATCFFSYDGGLTTHLDC